MMLNCDQIFLTISSNVLCFLLILYIFTQDTLAATQLGKRLKKWQQLGEGCSGKLLVIIWRYKSPTGNKLEVLTVIAVTCYSEIVYYSLFL